MKTLTIRAIGTPTESWQRDAIKMYQERLVPYGGVDIIELPEGHRKSAKPDEVQTKKTEAESLLKGIPPHAFVVALDERGKSYSSPEWAEKLTEWSQDNRQHVVFLIGGAWGLDASIRKDADVVLSMGPMTFPHGMARVFLLEQLYRARTLLAGKPYHK